MTTTTEKTAQVAQAEAYVRSRFYPPLPVEYGALAVEAVDLVNDGKGDVELDVGHLNPIPRDAEDGKISALALVYALRLDHLVHPEEETCYACGGTGWREEPMPRDEADVRAEKVCPTCEGTGLI